MARATQSETIMLVIIVVLVIIVAILVLKHLMANRKVNSRRRDRNSDFDSKSSFDSKPNSGSSSSSDHSRVAVRTDQKIDLPAPITNTDAQISFNVKHPKPATIPTFARESTYTNNSEYKFDHGRFEVKASNRKKSDLPKAFSAIKEWEGMITGVYDQERCGSCWAFSTCSTLTDRIKIKSKGKALPDGDYISPFQLATCMKCGTDNVCPKVCEGNYLDDVLEYLVQTGAVAQSDVDRHVASNAKLNEDNATGYECFDYKAIGAKIWKGTKKYRVNLFPPGLLVNAANLKKNEEAMMQEIMDHGPIVTIFKIYVPNDSRNFYFYKSGIYGQGWKDEPKQTDGYHAMSIVGWGEEIIDSKPVKYWIVRNSWGDSFGTMGFCRILKGENFGMVESDAWGISPDV